MSHTSVVTDIILIATTICSRSCVCGLQEKGAPRFRAALGWGRPRRRPSFLLPSPAGPVLNGYLYIVVPYQSFTDLLRPCCNGPRAEAT